MTVKADKKTFSVQTEWSFSTCGLKFSPVAWNQLRDWTSASLYEERPSKLVLLSMSVWLCDQVLCNAGEGSINEVASMIYCNVKRNTVIAGKALSGSETPINIIKHPVQWWYDPNWGPLKTTSNTQDCTRQKPTSSLWQAHLPKPSRAKSVLPYSSFFAKGSK